MLQPSEAAIVIARPEVADHQRRFPGRGGAAKNKPKQASGCKLGIVVITGVPVVRAELDRCEDDADVETIERSCEQCRRPAQHDFGALPTGFTEHRFMCIEHFLRRAKGFIASPYS